MKNGFIRGKSLYPAHYGLLMFTKGEPARSGRPKLRPSKCRHCGEYIKDYGGYLPIIERKGINLSDFWDDLSPVRHANRKHRRANELPEILFERIIAISGYRGGLDVDPFAGTGSGVIAAVHKGLRFAACDLVRANCNIISRRLDTLMAQLSRKKKNARTSQRLSEETFFLEMFTRDISLEDCILDLIDNSIDALVKARQVDISSAVFQKNGSKPDASSLPSVHVNFSPTEVRVADNCGGITFEEARTRSLISVTALSLCVVSWARMELASNVPSSKSGMIS